MGTTPTATGFREAFTRGLPDVATDRVVLVGAGGAGSAVAYAILSLGVGQLTVVDAGSRRGRAEDLAGGPRPAASRPGAVRAAEPAELEALLARRTGCPRDPHRHGRPSGHRRARRAARPAPVGR